MYIAIAVGVFVCLHLIVRSGINQWHKKACTSCTENEKMAKFHQDMCSNVRKRITERDTENQARYIEVVKLHRAHSKKSRKMQLFKDILSEIPPMIRENAKSRVEERRETARVAAKALTKQHTAKRNHAINLEAEARKAAIMA